MKIIYLFSAIIVFSQAAQSQTMSLHKYDGSVVEFQLSEVDSIGFSVSPTSAGSISADAEQTDIGEAVQKAGNTGIIIVNGSGHAAAVSTPSAVNKEGSVTRTAAAKRTADIDTDKK